MGASTTALIGLALWSVVLTFVLVTARMVALTSGKKEELNKFEPNGTDLPEWGHRITRAHANSLDYLAIGVGLLGIAIMTGQTAITDGLAMLVLGARIAQSLTHMISTSKPMVLIRATFFSVQMVIYLIWAIKLIQN